MNKYNNLCEEIHKQWTEDTLDIEKKFGFDLNALPEPYLSFGNQTHDISFLTTNPGGVMDFHNTNEEYTVLSQRLATHYEEHLTNAAKTRVSNMYKIAQTLDNKSEGFVQYEISPFHSSNFPNKETFARFVLNNENSTHTKYATALKEQLKEKNCICIQAGYPDLERLDTQWLTLISNILSVAKDKWKSISFKEKNGKETTGAFYYKTDDFFKVILFNSAGNSCPKIESMNELFNLLKN